MAKSMWTIIVWGCFSCFQLGSIFPFKLPLKAYSDILYHCVLNLQQPFGEGPFLFQHAPERKARSMKKWFSQFGVVISLHRALTSTPSNTFVTDWKTDCEQTLSSMPSPNWLNNIEKHFGSIPWTFWLQRG